MVEALIPDVWQYIIDYLDLCSQLNLMSTCKSLRGFYIHSIKHDESVMIKPESLNFALKLPKFDKLTSLCLYGLYGGKTIGYNFIQLKLTSLNMIGGQLTGLENITGLLALSLSSVMLSNSQIINSDLLRLDIYDSGWANIDKLTKLTYLRCNQRSTTTFKRAPLLELNISHYNSHWDKLSKLTRLTKLTLHLPDNVTNISNMQLVELSLIGGTTRLITVDRITTLTGLTVLHCAVSYEGPKLRNLCVCRCLKIKADSSPFLTVVECHH
jgi:hypothetical protein